MRVQSLSQEDPLEKEMETIPVFSLPGKSNGQRNWVGYSPRGRKESDMTEWFHFTSQSTNKHFCTFSTIRNNTLNTEIWVHEQILMEKEMATHSSVLAWRIPGTEEPGGLPSLGSHRVGHDWSDLAAAAEQILRVQTQEAVTLGGFKQKEWWGKDCKGDLQHSIF